MSKRLKTAGIYSITNLQNGKVYYGSSSDIYRRFINHRNELKTNRHKNPHLQRSWNKYGENGFIFTIEEEVPSADLSKIEQHYLSWCKLFPFYSYNIGYDSICPSRGLTRSTETRTKMSMSKRGKNHPFFGKHLPETTKTKLRQSLTGRIVSAETKSKMKLACMGTRNHNFGKRRSKETNLKIIQKLTGQHRSDEFKLKMHLSQSGKNHSQYDHKIYNFIHPQHGIELLTQYELRKKYNLNQGNLGQLIKQKTTSVGGWKINE